MHLFLISLPQPPARRESALTKLHDAKLRFEIVDGVEANRWRQEALPVTDDVWPDQPVGQIGCYLAHLRALRRLIDYRLNWACILEDDFCFEPDPDFGIDAIEGTLPKDFHYIHLQRDLGINPGFQVVQRCGLYNRILGTPLCSAGYVITRPLAQHILAHHANFSMPIDHLYAALSQQGRFYATVKPIIGIQTGLDSNM